MAKGKTMVKKRKKRGSKKGRKKINVKVLLFLMGLASVPVCIVCLSREDIFFACVVLTIGMLLSFPYFLEESEDYENLTLVSFYKYCAVLIIFIVAWIVFFAYKVKEFF